MNPYTVELYSSDGNNFAHVDLDDAEFRATIKVAVALNKQKRPNDCRPIMHVYEGHVEPNFFGNDGAFEEIV